MIKGYVYGVTFGHLTVRVVVSYEQRDDCIAIARRAILEGDNDWEKQEYGDSTCSSLTFIGAANVTEDVAPQIVEEIRVPIFPDTVEEGWH